MKDYLLELINAINDFDTSEKSYTRLRDLVCFISDNEQWSKDYIYRMALYEAAQKLRVFGYIKGPNKIDADELKMNEISTIKHQAIQNFYKSDVYENNLLDKYQKQIITLYMSLEKKRLLISAPTSFGKTFLLREIIYLNKDRYHNILLVFPTIALLNENTESINDFIKKKRLKYTVVNNVYSNIDISERNVFILTPERTLKLLADNENLDIDFFFFDEVYKIDEDFNKDEDSSDTYRTKVSNRAKAFRIVLYLLSKHVKEYYLAGPYLELNNVKKGFEKYCKSNTITVQEIKFEPTMKIQIDAWNKTITQHHPILGSKTLFKIEDRINTDVKVKKILEYIKRESLGQAIFYCNSPARTIGYAKKIIETLPENRNIITNHGDFINHLVRRYNVIENINGNKINSSDYWSFIEILKKGYGIHHGKFPKYIQKEIMNMFNKGDIKYLFCTSTIIEGVNTNAKNVVVINSSVGMKKMTSFVLKNIKGRAGRYYHHFIGRVFYINAEQKKIECQENIKLNFSIYDDNKLLNIDIDNSDESDLCASNKTIKRERESTFDRNLLPDEVFIKNRLIERDVQEKYLLFLCEKDVFNTFKEILHNNNIRYFLTNGIVGKILGSMAQVSILTENEKLVYQSVVSNYCNKQFMGLLSYQLKNKILNVNHIDGAYLEVFRQIRTIIEYEVPRLLCLFESIFSQAAKLKGIEIENFNLSMIIRFFELGVSSAIGLHLVEYGYPIEAIRSIEKRFRVLSMMDLSESIRYIKANVSKLIEILDRYEFNLLMNAIQQ